jgi:hypothetical protein
VNEFDKHMGSSIDLSDTELNGFFKAIAKAVKKTTKSVGHWVDNRAAFVKSAGKKLKKLGNTVVGKEIKSMAVSVAAGLVGGPIAAASTRIKTSGLTSKLSDKQKDALTAGVSALVSGKAPDSANEILNSAKGMIRNVEGEIVDLANNPAFKKAHDALKKKGYTENQIVQIWAQSGAYADSAIPTIAENIQPLIYNEKLSEGYSQEDAQIIARNQSDIVAANSVDKIRKLYSAGSVAPIALGALAVLLLATK